MKPRNDSFEIGDSTALVCVDDEEIEPVVADQLDSLGFKIHTGLFREDIFVRIQTHTYDVLVVHDRYEGGDLETNGVLENCRRLIPEQRRAIFIVLVGANLPTKDGLLAFQYSVDLVCGLPDLGNLAAILERCLEERKLFYRHFEACEEEAALA